MKYLLDNLRRAVAEYKSRVDEIAAGPKPGQEKLNDITAIHEEAMQLVLHCQKHMDRMGVELLITEEGKQ